ncbi:hypothetical protein PNOK_0611600 [Pyrrhoderma noxium]|uniref:Uncharacterized protein n=1 Tax=Pyrrhoderma noxium TaxID=2282107 RepID=A0A286UDH0_9AGAM|nr:hypothetical protein PNOK_0611600 [Pyrrhoderma noxium]
MSRKPFGGLVVDSTLLCATNHRSDQHITLSSTRTEWVYIQLDGHSHPQGVMLTRRAKRRRTKGERAGERAN